MKKRIILGAIAIIVIAGVVLGFTLFKNGRTTGDLYKQEEIARGNVEALVVTTGTLNPVTIVDVGSQVSGKIEKLYVDFNSEVTSGQVIAELDQELFQTRIQQNEANYNSSVAALDKSKVTLDNTEKKYERSKALFEKDLLSFEEMDQAEVAYFNAQADLKSAEARLEQAKSQLDSSIVDLTYTVIKSPIDGVVIDRRVNVGQTVAASMQAPVLFQIANDLSKMQVECSVDEADIGRVKEGQKVRFNVDAFPDDEFQGVVSQVRYSPLVTQNVVTYTTIVAVENPELKLMPGMTATISIVTGEALDVLLVPNAALRFTPDLSQEEMRAIFEEMRSSSGGQNAQVTATKKPRGGNGEQGSEGQTAGGDRSAMGIRQGGQQNSGQRQQRPRVWVQDESGKLGMVFLQTGVTDNSLTEIVAGDLGEGQLVITGTNVTSSRRNDFGPPGGPMGMFMRR